MIFAEEVAQVVALAALTEDRTAQEQRALLRVAHWVDKRLNTQTLTNPVAEKYFWEPSRLGRLVGCDCVKCSAWPDRTYRDDPIPVNAQTPSHVGRDDA